MINIYRFRSSEQGTLGMFIMNDWICTVLELPWLNNQRMISCIPDGKYDLTLVKSPKYGLVYLFKDVPNRSGILIHSGNFAGNEALGWKTHSQGCLLFGKYHGTLPGPKGPQEAVLYSKPTMTRFLEKLNGADFKLTIGGLKNVGYFGSNI